MINIDEFVNSFYRGSKKTSLNAIKFFMNYYNNFEKNMKFIHIAGTNGKGSCTEIISNILIKQGYKVGKFLSPHLVKYNERISINGINISDSELSNYIEELQPIMDNYTSIYDSHVSLFEFTTIVALLYFYRNKVDFVVLETGLGGLTDSTNIITKPLVSVITSIGYDHMHILGSTLPEIAQQKAGIIKNNSNTVIIDQSPEINDIFINECKKMNNNLHIVRISDISNYRFDNTYQYFSYKNLDNICINLKGKFQINNSALCIEVINILNELGFSIDTNNLLSGLNTVVHKGRMELINDNPKIFYDGAHNEPAFQQLVEMSNMYFPNTEKKYIISILVRKDYSKMLKILSTDKNASFILTSGISEKYATSDDLFENMKDFVNINKLIKSDFTTALTRAVNDKSDCVYIIAGSLYPYKEAIDILTNNRY